MENHELKITNEEKKILDSRHNLAEGIESCFQISSKGSRKDKMSSLFKTIKESDLSEEDINDVILHQLSMNVGNGMGFSVFDMVISELKESGFKIYDELLTNIGKSAVDYAVKHKRGYRVEEIRKHFSLSDLSKI